MTKTELKKQEIKKVLNMLIKEFNIYNIEREYQYFDFWADYKDHVLNFQMDTRDYSIASSDAIKLAGDGWSQEDIDKQIAAATLEELMDKKIRELVAS